MSAGSFCLGGCEREEALPAFAAPASEIQPDETVPAAPIGVFSLPSGPQPPTEHAEPPPPMAGDLAGPRGEAEPSLRPSPRGDDLARIRAGRSWRAASPRGPMPGADGLQHDEKDPMADPRSHVRPDRSEWIDAIRTAGFEGALQMVDEEIYVTVRRRRFVLARLKQKAAGLLERVVSGELSGEARDGWEAASAAYETLSRRTTSHHADGDCGTLLLTRRKRSREEDKEGLVASFHDFVEALTPEVIQTSSRFLLDNSISLAEAKASQAELHSSTAAEHSVTDDYLRKLKKELREKQSSMEVQSRRQHWLLLLAMRVVQEREQDRRLVAQFSQGLQALVRGVHLPADQVREAFDCLTVLNASDSPFHRTSGLAFSGGGVRAAAQAVGALRYMEEMDSLEWFDWISSVSGGGYTACSLMSELYQAAKKDTKSPREPQLSRVRVVHDDDQPPVGVPAAEQPISRSLSESHVGQGSPDMAPLQSDQRRVEDLNFLRKAVKNIYHRMQFGSPWVTLSFVSKVVGVTCLSLLWHAAVTLVGHHMWFFQLMVLFRVSYVGEYLDRVYFLLLCLITLPLFAYTKLIYTYTVQTCSHRRRLGKISSTLSALVCIGYIVGVCFWARSYESYENSRVYQSFPWGILVVMVLTIFAMWQRTTRNFRSAKVQVISNHAACKAFAYSFQEWVQFMGFRLYIITLSYCFYRWNPELSMTMDVTIGAVEVPFEILLLAFVIAYVAFLYFFVYVWDTNLSDRGEYKGDFLSFVFTVVRIYIIVKVEIGLIALSAPIFKDWRCQYKDSPYEAACQWPPCSAVETSCYSYDNYDARTDATDHYCYGGTRSCPAYESRVCYVCAGAFTIPENFGLFHDVYLPMLIAAICILLCAAPFGKQVTPWSWGSCRLGYKQHSGADLRDTKKREREDKGMSLSEAMEVPVRDH